MKTLKAGLFLLASVCSMTFLHAQTVDEIVSKHILAIGGKDILTAIKTVYTENSIDVMGAQASGVSYLITGKGTKSEVDFNGAKIVQCVTDKGGWTINPGMGATSATPLPDDQVKAQQINLDPAGPFLNYAAKGYNLSMLGTDTAGGAKAYKVKLTTKEGNTVTYFFDAGTYYINKVINKSTVGGQEIETTVNFSDYRKTDFGFVMPYSLSIILPQVTLNITNTKVEINKPLDPSIFDMPK